MNNPATMARALRAAEICRERGMTQAQIAEAVGASQSQVSRILSGRGVRESRLLEAVCLYVERYGGRDVSVEAVRTNQEIVTAVQSVWDGSAAHAKALSTVIRSLAALAPSPSDSVQSKQRGKG
ncbi:helix-turn-helix transcriptional regulator [Piscinibacter sp.]|uniref:helix-turn-helix transcriptional regulator n=1 Tax=Piscinibacter sp. TaxID=1903157 RepID=UPI001D827091|nr:helix-turn-helix transcriptional regulator [Piscinibacter sp.]